MMDVSLWREYLGQLEKLGNTLEELTQVEREKTAAVGRGDLDAVDACMRREQVFSLNLRGFDQKREKMLARLGISGSTLDQLEDLAPPETALETKRTVEKVRQRYRVFRSASDAARDILECNLHEIEKRQKVPPQEVMPGDLPGAAQSDFRA